MPHTRPRRAKISQSAAIADKFSAAKRQFDQTVGIYPECRREIRYDTGKNRLHAGEGLRSGDGSQEREPCDAAITSSHLRIAWVMALYHMPDTLDASQYEFPLAALIDAICSTEAESKWAELHSAQERAISALENRRTELNSLYERALVPDTNWEDITQVASMIGEWERAAAEKLFPQIDALQQKLAAPDNDMPLEVRRARQESMRVAESWLMLYRDLRIKLLRLAAGRRPTDAVLPARPVEGEIDYAGLSREHLARYPKIRAALAE